MSDDIVDAGITPPDLADDAAELEGTGEQDATGGAMPAQNLEDAEFGAPKETPPA